MSVKEKKSLWLRVYIRSIRGEKHRDDRGDIWVDLRRE